MEPLNPDALPRGALLLIDSAPIICFPEQHPTLAAHFTPLFAAHAAGRLRFAVTTVALVEVLTGALQAGDAAFADRYRATLETWQVV